MGIALIGLTALMHTVQRLSTPARPVALAATTTPLPAAARSPWAPSTPVRRVSPARHPSALRVVRVCEAHDGPHHTGRMVISGRMADVCAELDRLAAREAQHHASSLRQPQH